MNNLILNDFGVNPYLIEKYVDMGLPFDPIIIFSNWYILENNLIQIVELDDNGNYVKDYPISDKAVTLFEKIKYLKDIMNLNYTIKCNEFENYNSQIYSITRQISEIVSRPVNCHLFHGKKSFGSFGWHTDNEHVLTYMISGTKIMYVDDKIFELNTGSWLHIPKGIKHKAENLTSTLMLSFGVSDFYITSLNLLD